MIPHLDGILSEDQCRETAASIARAQLPSGAVPWFIGGHTDPWDHVQSAMALTAAGWTTQAERAYEWSRTTQRPDGSWAAKYLGDRIADASVDANFCAYIATGVWHHWSVTGDATFVERMWPTVRGAVGVVLSLQAPGGEIYWGRDRAGTRTEVLVTGNASVHTSLRCAIGLAELVGVLVPEWELAAARLRHALDDHPERFTDKSRYSMDWYYPILGGTLAADRVTERLVARWDEFVVPGLGIRCVADQPWVTGAETCELVLALEAAGRREDALEQLAAMQHLRHSDGSYWTGFVYPDNERWPVEQTAWTGATVILATDALCGATGGGGLFRGAGLAPATLEGSCPCPATR